MHPGKSVRASDHATCPTLLRVERDGDRLIEIQYGSLGAISRKVENLIQNHDVTVVKPLAARKYLIKRTRKNGKVKSKRYSPSKETFFSPFLDTLPNSNIPPRASSQ